MSERWAGQLKELKDYWKSEKWQKLKRLEKEQIMALDLPTTETNTNSGEQKKALPAGAYQAKLAYYYFDQSTFVDTPYAYQDVGFRWLILPSEVLEHDDPDDMGRTIAEALDENGFYPYTDRYNELHLKAEWLNPATKRTIKPSVFIRRLNALVHGQTSFSDTDGKNLEYLVDEEKFQALGSFPVYQSINLKESEEYEKTTGHKPGGVDQYKITDRKQTIYKGVVKDIKVNGVSTVGSWATIDLGVNVKGYNTAGANAVRALNNLERMGLKGEGYDLPGVAGKKAPPVGAPT